MLKITVEAYMHFLESAAEEIGKNRDYVTELDAQTGDGDHWANIHMGFEKLLEQKEQLLSKDLSNFMSGIAKILMAGIGGSSGVLYGGAYLEGAKICAGQIHLDEWGLCRMLESWLASMVKRGGAKPGDKTMLDALAPASSAYRQALEANMPSADALYALKKAALDGAESTREMEAVKGRACYQKDKGVGHLDPGAVTMAMQLACLADYAAKNCTGGNA